MKLSNYIVKLLVLLLVFQFETAYSQEETPPVKDETAAPAAAELSKDEIKEKLKQLTPEQRLEAISRAEVVEKKMDLMHRQAPEKIAEIDMVQEVSQICGKYFNYSPNESKPNVGWPTLTCKYKQDNLTLSGATRKFYCEFNEVNKKGVEIVKRRKVKYAMGGLFGGINKSELVPTIMASTMARMIGFPTESYCPAKIKCVGCPSNDPWKENNRASGNPSNETHDFDYAMVEMPADLMTITPNTARVSANMPHGLYWEELQNVVDTQGKTAREKLIEREAWLLWVNFLADTDALFFNQRISCDKASVKDGQVQCDKPIAYAHDYGHAFNYRFKYDRWRTHVPLHQAKDGTCRGGLTDKLLKDERGDTQKGIHVSPSISSEARDFLVSRMKNLSDKQWKDVMRISNAERIFRTNPDDFVKVMKYKIDLMSRVQCASFDSRTSVLAPK